MVKILKLEDGETTTYIVYNVIKNIELARFDTYVEALEYQKSMK